MENQKPDLGFNIQRILDCGFQIEEAIDPDPNDTLISYGMGFHFDVKESWVQYVIRADFIKGQKEVFAWGTVLTRFGIQDLKSFADENGDVTWPPNALEAMFGIAFSHLRAVVAKNMAGTRFAMFLIPLINPGAMFKQLIERDPIYNAVYNPERAKQHVENQIGVKKEAIPQNIDDAYSELPSKASKEKIRKKYNK